MFPRGGGSMVTHQERWKASVEDDGIARFPSLPPEVGLHLDLLDSEELRVVADARDVVLRVREGGSLLVHTLDLEGRGLPATVFPFREESPAPYDEWSTASTAGELLVAPLAPARYDLVATYGETIGALHAIDAGTGRREVSVVLGTEAVLRLENDLDELVSFRATSQGLHVGHGELAPHQWRRLPVLAGPAHVSFSRASSAPRDLELQAGAAASRILVSEVLGR